MSEGWARKMNKKFLRQVYLQMSTDEHSFFKRIIKKSSVFIRVYLWTILFFVLTNQAQIAIDPVVKKVEPKQIMPKVNLTIGRYLDLINGTTADEAVKIALQNNGEIQAMRDELEARKALIKQAELRPNPRLKITGSQEGIIGNRYSVGASVSIPLELGGRRKVRIDVAKKQFDLRKMVLAESERKLATEVRKMFGMSLAKIEKLRFLEELLANVEQGYKLISAKVTEGSNAPLEQNMSIVELNRIRSMRETAVAETEIKLLELRNILGLEPTESLRLKGDFKNLLAKKIPTRKEATEQAIQNRPDLESLRLIIVVGKAKLEQARSESRLDAEASLGFQRMTRIQPMLVNQNPVELEPNRIGENFITFGMDLMLPIRNKNQGNIEAATLQINAAEKRLKFGELTVRREVFTAYTRFEASVRALTIYQNGVRDQAKQNLQVVWQTYDLGEKDLIDYIAEERRYLDLENNLIDSELAVYLARISIYQSINSPKLIGN